MAELLYLHADQVLTTLYAIGSLGLAVLSGALFVLGVQALRS